MTFLSPIWLILLAPWAALAIWMMWGRRSATRVPFLDLWRGSAARPASTRLFRPPPLAIIAILAAMLLGIVGAAEPMVFLGAHDMPIVTIVLDRGIAMSAQGRRAEVIEAAEKVLRRDAPGARVRLVTVPAVAEELEWPAGAKSAPPTAIETSAMIGPVVAEALRDDGQVIVLSDQPISADARVAQIAPARSPGNVGIARFAIRERPAPQAMVAIRNDSSHSQAELSVDGVARTIDLPPRGETKGYFVNLARVGEMSEARIAVNDELELDNVAWLTRQRDWPRIEMRPPLPREVERVVQAYERARPAGESGPRIVVTSSGESAADRPAVIVAMPSGGAVIDPAAMKVRDHPITRNVNWSNVGLGAIARPGDPSFTPVVTAGSQPLIAVVETPVRRVRINFEAAEVSRTPEFVILWTNILDWLAGGGGGETFAAKPMNELDVTWKPRDPDRQMLPGIYERGDGAIAAFNASAPVFPSVSTRVSRLTLREGASHSGARLNLLPWLVLSAIGCMIVAAWAWPRKRLTPVFSPRTV